MYPPRLFKRETASLLGIWVNIIQIPVQGMWQAKASPRRNASLPHTPSHTRVKLLWSVFTSKKPVSPCSEALKFPKGSDISHHIYTFM